MSAFPQGSSCGSRIHESADYVEGILPQGHHLSARGRLPRRGARPVLAIMKAITIWQPYAAAIAVGLKRYETRSWATKHRGPLAIHAAAKNLSLSDYSALLEALTGHGRRKMPAFDDLQFGAVVAVCNLKDCLEMGSALIDRVSQNELVLGDWRRRRFAWHLRSVQFLDTPFYVSGKQGLWNWKPPRHVRESFSG